MGQSTSRTNRRELDENQGIRVIARIMLEIEKDRFRFFLATADNSPFYVHEQI